MNIEKFEQQGVVTEAALRLLVHSFPNNLVLEEVFLKVAAINSVYGTNIFALETAARHIHSLDIDGALLASDHAVVHRIAEMTIGERVRNNYSFATKYCSWHRPDDYPIYDSLIDGQLWRYRAQDNFLDFDRDQMRDYESFRRILQAFSEFYGLGHFTTREIDKYLWVQAKGF